MHHGLPQCLGRADITSGRFSPCERSCVAGEDPVGAPPTSTPFHARTCLCNLGAGNRSGDGEACVAAAMKRGRGRQKTGGAQRTNEASTRAAPHTICECQTFVIHPRLRGNSSRADFRPSPRQGFGAGAANELACCGHIETMFFAPPAARVLMVVSTRLTRLHFCFQELVGV